MGTAEDILRRIIEPLVSNIPLHSDCHILTLSFVIPEPIRNPISSHHHSLASLVNTSLFGVIGNSRATENVFRSTHPVPTKSRTEAEGVALYFMLTTMSVQHI